MLLILFPRASQCHSVDIDDSDDDLTMDLPDGKLKNKIYRGKNGDHGTGCFQYSPDLWCANQAVANLS
jgi:hypothetical protein